MRDLDKDVNDLLEPFQGSFNPAEDQAVACTLLVNHLSMRRNKRCLLAYHRTRTDKLEELVWNGADIVDLSGQQVRDGSSSAPANAAATSSLSPQEEDYVRQYSDLLAAYKGQYTDVDLTGSLLPPKDLFIDVRVLKDAGEIQTEYGYVYDVYVSSTLSSCDIQRHHAHQKQPVLRPTGRCRASDCAGISPETELKNAARLPGTAVPYSVHTPHRRRLR